MNGLTPSEQNLHAQAYALLHGIAQAGTDLLRIRGTVDGCYPSPADCNAQSSDNVAGMLSLAIANLSDLRTTIEILSQLIEAPKVVDLNSTRAPVPASSQQLLGQSAKAYQTQSRAG